MHALPAVLAPAEEERRRVSLGLPAHLLWLSADRLAREGWRLRGDVPIQLSRAAATALIGLAPHRVARCARMVDEAAVALLRDLSFDDPRDGLLSCAMLTLKLVDEGLFPDAANQAVLVATLLVRDAEEPGSEFALNVPVLQYNVGKMLIRLNLLGYYGSIVLPAAKE